MWVGGKVVAVAADEIDDQPDHSDEDEKGRKEQKGSEGLRDDGLRAVDGGPVSEVGGAGHDG